MNKRVVLPVFSGLISGLFLVVSCGRPAATTTTVPPTTGAYPQPSTSQASPPAGANTVTLTLRKLDGTTVTKVAERPKYGGSISLVLNSDPTQWDASSFPNSGNANHNFSGNEMMTGDWARGPAGTGERTWRVSGSYETKTWRGELAEGFEVPDNETIVFHLRKGVHYGLNPASEASRLVNGREFTAADAAAEYEREWLKSPKSFVMGTTAPGERILSARALDKYTVEIKVPPAFMGPLIIMTAEQTYIGGYAPEVVQKYTNLEDWHLSVGTGPWILKDYVPGSTITRVRNPNYFETDPLFPENGLPYADTLKQFIIPDASTRLAALRTGKIDQLGGTGVQISFEDQQSLKQTTPRLQFIQITPQAAMAVGGRMDKPDLPFKDLRVRKALSMAINRDEMVKGYYGGEADAYGYPYTKEINPQLYIPFDQLPKDAQEVLSYNPTKARQLLAEAGYPNGFKTSVLLQQADVDVVNIVKAYFQKIGVDMTLDVREAGVVSTMTRGRAFSEMVYGNTQENWAVWKMHGIRAESATNYQFFQGDARARAVYDQVNQYLGRDDEKVGKLLRDFAPYFIENVVWGATLPLPHTYAVYQPWLKNFSAEEHVGYWDPDEAWRFRWVDLDMKRSLGY